MSIEKTEIRVVVGNRVTFDSDDGVLAGFVNDLRRDLGNGEPYAWIEIDHQWRGMFRAVPLSAILTSERIGPPSVMHVGVDWAAGPDDFVSQYLLAAPEVGRDAREKGGSI